MPKNLRQISRKLHAATNKLTNANCTVWVVERKTIEHSPNQELLWNVLKRDMQMLQKLRFPLIVSVSKPLEDVKSALVVETEPVAMSMASWLEAKMPLDELEIKLGVIQLVEALSFVHSTAQLIHLNLCPSSVAICSAGWKLAGFAHALPQSSAEQSPPIFDATPQSAMSSADRPRSLAPRSDATKPSLPYTAPEVVFLNALTPAADMFSLGCLIYELFGLCENQSPRRLLNNCDTVDAYRRSIEEMLPLQMDHIPVAFRTAFASLLSTDPTKRPSCQNLLQSDYFNDTAIKTLQYLSHMTQHDDRSKAEFLKGLKIALGTLSFSNKILEAKFLPPLLAELRNTILVPLLLPNLFSIAEMLEKNSNTQAPTKNGIFGALIFPAIAPLAGLRDPIQCVVILLQRLEWMSKRVYDQHLAKVLVPMACAALDLTLGPVAILSLREILSILPLVDHETIRTTLFPRVVGLVHNPKTPQVLRVHALFAVSKLIPFAARAFIETTVLPSVLQTISIDRSGTTLTSIGGVCDVISLKFGPEFTALNLLPHLVPLLIDAGLQRKQFDTLHAIITGMLTRLAEARRKVYDEADARQAPAASATPSGSDEERLQAFSAQLPAVSAPMVHSASQPTMTRTPTNSRPSTPGAENTAQRTAPAPPNPKGAAAFNAILASQERRVQAAQVEKKRNSLLDLEETASTELGQSPQSAFTGFDADLFSLSTTGFNMDAFVLPTPTVNQSPLSTNLFPMAAVEPISTASLFPSTASGPSAATLAPAVLPQVTAATPAFLLPSTPHPPVAAAPPALLPSAAPVFPSITASIFPSAPPSVTAAPPMHIPTNTTATDAEDDFFDPRAMSRPKSTPEARAPNFASTSTPGLLPSSTSPAIAPTFDFASPPTAYPGHSAPLLPDASFTSVAPVSIPPNALDFFS